MLLKVMTYLRHKVLQYLIRLGPLQKVSNIYHQTIFPDLFRTTLRQKG